MKSWPRFLNARSFCRIQEAGLILSRGLAHVIASDAHDTLVRTPGLSSLRNYVEDKFGFDYAQVLLEENPARICENRPPVRTD